MLSLGILLLSSSTHPECLIVAAFRVLVIDCDEDTCMLNLDWICDCTPVPVDIVQLQAKAKRAEVSARPAAAPATVNPLVF